MESRVLWYTGEGRTIINYVVAGCPKPFMMTTVPKEMDEEEVRVLVGINDTSYERVDGFEHLDEISLTDGETPVEVREQRARDYINRCNPTLETTMDPDTAAFLRIRHEIGKV